MRNSQLIACFNKKIALYNKMKAKICDKYKITPTSFDVIMFLHNNADVKTAEEICRLRGIKPAIVSVDIDKLIKLGYITRTVDVNDRRRQLISLSEKVDVLTQDGKKMQQYFINTIMQGIDEKEAEIYFTVLDKVLVNINKCEKEGFDFGE